MDHPREPEASRLRIDGGDNMEDRMPRRCGAALALVLATSAPALSEPYGLWLRDDGNARVEIAPCGDNLCATNVWIGDTSGGEEVGDRLVMSLNPAGSNRLTGNAYDPKRDMRYAITLSYDGSTMQTRGCVAAILCRSVNWTAAR